ncbi:hypothetical protein SEUCBS139899_000165 [Sporothrix eucalyptigena]|uniref:Peptidase A1 domain-containing protein n=1 Tax=Sporothrix eucalyptigena TaxID=1812306 RepID=A0ABP0C804_9PEZI
MAVLSVLLGSFAAASLVTAAPAGGSTYERHNQHRSPHHYIVPRAPAVALAQHTFPLERRVVTGRARPRPWHNPDRQPVPTKYTQLAPEGPPSGANVSTGSAPAANHDIEYITQVQAGQNNLSLVVDTGSSDTWFVQQNFECVDPQYHTPVLAAYCAFGPAFKGDFPGGAITNQHLSVAYGSEGGPFIQGTLGYSDLMVSGFKTAKQIIGLALQGYWDGDGVTSGLLGLGLPGLTNAFAGSLADANTRSGALSDVLHGPVEYNPLVSTLAAANNITQFSLALSRDPGESVLALGGAPPNVPIDESLGWVTTPIVKTQLRKSTAPSYMYYTISVEQIIFNSSTLVRNFTTAAMPTMGTQPLAEAPIIVDSGTTLNLFPYDIAEAINQLYVPHAQYDPDQGIFEVRCDATPPSLGIKIAGKTIWTDPKSMIMTPSRSGAGLGNGGMCLSGIGVRTDTPYILGDVFMQQLVTVFDTANLEIKFAKRLPSTGTKTAQPSPAKPGNPLKPSKSSKPTPK